MKNVSKRIVLILCLSTLISIGTKAQISLIKDYQNFNSPKIGTFQGINFREAGFSGLFPIQNTNGKEFWTISDRGVNVDAANANPSTCRPTYDKVYAFKAYAPKIHRIKIDGDSIQILKTITMKRPNGTTASGLLNPTGFGSTSVELISTDTVLNCANFLTKTTAKDVWGIDAEGVTVDRNGNFWICEEGGPTIWVLNSEGVVLKRYTPYKNLVGSESIDVAIDTVFKYRKNNRGFEGICITPNGKVYAIIQSPILFPTKTVGESSRIHRILEIDPVSNATKMYAYLNDGIIGASGSNQIRLRDWKMGDMAAINDTSFLVIEQAFRGTSGFQKIHRISINGASNVSSGLYNGVTLEALVDSNGLATNNIKPVKKTLFMDMLANGWSITLDKAEGLAIVNDSTIAICNDNDYAQSSPTENGVATATTTTSHLYLYSLKSNNKVAGFKLYAPASNITLANHSKVASLLFTNYDIPNIQTYKLVSSMDTLAQTPNFVFGGSADGIGLLKNSDGTFTILTNHEDNFSVSRVTLDANFKPINGQYIMNSNAGIWRLCSGTMATPAIHGFGPVFLTCGESGEESMTHALNPYTSPVVDTLLTEATSFTIAKGLGRWSAENAVPLPKETYPGKTVIVIGDDDSGPAGGQVALYIGNTGDLQNGNLYALRLNTNNYKETRMKANGLTHDFEFVQIPNHKALTGSQINTFCQSINAVRFGRVEDVDFRKGNAAAGREIYFTVTGQDYTGVNADTSRTKYGRVYRMKLNAMNPLIGSIECVMDGDDKSPSNGARTFYDVDNIVVTNDYVYVQEDPNGYAPSGNPSRHDARIYQYDIETRNVFQVCELDHRRKATDSLIYNQNLSATGYASSSTGSWEFGGMIDISDEVNTPNTFLLALQPHTWRSNRFKGVDGGTLRKSEFQGSVLVVLKNIPRAKVKLPFVKDVTVCKGEEVVLTATGGYANAEYRWYSAASGGNLLHVGNDFKVVANLLTTYFVSATALGSESATQSLNVFVVDKPVVNLPSSIVACGDTTISLNVPAVTYLWSDNSTGPNFKAQQSGTYWVMVKNQNGCFDSDTVEVTINRLPTTPTITVSGLQLTSSNATGNQWYMDGNLIPNATAQTYTASTSGSYTVKTTDQLTGCVSLRSSNIGMVVLGIDDEYAANDFRVFPNPNDGNFTLKFRIEEQSNVRIQVINTLGQIIYMEDIKDFQGAYQEQLNLSEYSNGQYIINVFTDRINLQKIISKN